jgi:hypothetical protein
MQHYFRGIFEGENCVMYMVEAGEASLYRPCYRQKLFIWNEIICSMGKFKQIYVSLTISNSTRSIVMSRKCFECCVWRGINFTCNLISVHDGYGRKCINVFLVQFWSFSFKETCSYISCVCVFICRDSSVDWASGSTKEIDDSNKELQDTANELLNSVTDPKFTYSKVSWGKNW